MTTLFTMTCASCGKEFERAGYRVRYAAKQYRRPFCSRSCSVRGRWDRGSLEERFWAKVDRAGPEECWGWRAGRQRYGYGSFWTGRTIGMDKAHRVAYELAVGPIPAGLEILHDCDNPPCVNPNHLRVGTHAENMEDARTKGRLKPPPPRWRRETHCKRGHEFTDANVYHSSHGYRQCRECVRVRRMRVAP
jgi:hypothetical protein